MTRDPAPPRPDDALPEAAREAVQRALRELRKQNGAQYIVLCEFLNSRGTLSSGASGVRARPYWGFYSDLASRWQCAPNTIKNWLQEALRTVSDLLREEARNL